MLTLLIVKSKRLLDALEEEEDNEETHSLNHGTKVMLTLLSARLERRGLSSCLCGLIFCIC